MTRKINHLHWQTPTLLLCSFLVGVTLAIGHHCFYQSLHGKEVSAGSISIIGVQATQRQLVSVAGVSIAFVFKASLVLCASVAYIQLFFRANRTRAFTIETLDHWYAALEDVRSLFCISTYYRYPLLTLVALTAWLLPIAAVFAPAAISVTFDQIHPSMTRPLPVPRPAFDSLAFGSYVTNEWTKLSNATSIVLKGPSAEVSRIASAVAAGGNVLPIAPPASNTSWQVTFEAPRLRREDMDLNLRAAIRQNVLQALQESTANTKLYPAYDGSIGPVLSQYMPAYLSWTNASQHDTEVPSVKTSNKWELIAQRYLYDAELSTNLYVGIFPRALNSSSLGPDIFHGKLLDHNEARAERRNQRRTGARNNTG